MTSDPKPRAVPNPGPFQGRYGVSGANLVMAPFLFRPSEAKVEDEVEVPRDRRKHFVSIGNFNHLPNADACAWMMNEVWPRVRAQLGTNVELHMYGAHYCGHVRGGPTAPPAGVHMRGFAEEIGVLSKYMALVAPLRCGAGVKGKIVDAWRHGWVRLATRTT